MLHQNSVFHSVLKQVPWHRFDRLVDEHHADKHVRRLTTKGQLIALIYAQLSGAQSLREVEAALESHSAKLYHLGGEQVARATLSDANAQRPWQVFGGLFGHLVGQLTRGLKRKAGEAVHLIDATSLHLSALSGEWATFSAGVCGAKAHIIYDPDAERAALSDGSDRLQCQRHHGRQGDADRGGSDLRLRPRLLRLQAGGQRLMRKAAASSRGSRPTRRLRW